MKTLVWIWCFPQQLLGLLLKVITRAERREGYYAYRFTKGSCSLGEFIFLCPAHEGCERILKHEQGHTRQSYILGWMWVPAIGIPSLIWCSCFGWLRRKYNISYYSFYTEKWADKLGGVKE